MAQSVLTWTPATGTNSINQTVQYKKASSATWLTFNTVGPTVATITISGLLDNILYDFRIVDNCKVGGEIPSDTVSQISFVCPTAFTVGLPAGVSTLKLSPESDKIATDLFWYQSDVNKIVVQLYATNGTTLLQTRTIIPSASDISYTDIFGTLAASTNYKVKVTLYAGAGFIYNHVCTLFSVTTTATPVCGAPTGFDGNILNSEADLTWTPATGVNIINQIIQYKLSSSGTWIDFTTEPVDVAAETVTDLVPNTLYDFRVLSVCEVGGPTASSIIKRIEFSCFAATVTPSTTTIDVDFTVGDIASLSKIDVLLLSSTGSTIATQTISSPTATLYTQTFTGLTADTIYKVRLKLYAGDAFEYNSLCPSQTVQTTPVVLCSAPTGVSIEVGLDS